MALPVYTEFANPTPTGNFSDLSLSEACGLYEVFSNLSQQITAFANQPRFEGEAASLLDGLAEDADRKMQAMVGVIRSKTPADRIERDLKVKVLLRDAMLDTDDPAELASIASELASERH